MHLPVTFSAKVKKSLKQKEKVQAYPLLESCQRLVLFTCTMEHKSLLLHVYSRSFLRVQRVSACILIFQLLTSTVNWFLTSDKIYSEPKRTDF